MANGLTSESILEHIYRSRPASSRAVLPAYLAHPTPRPSLIYLPNVNPPTTLFSVLHANLLFLSPVSTETDPLYVLEFLHRVIDVLEEFVGAPLLPGKIEGAYDVVAQLLGEMCDAGSVCNTEPNALRDDVDTSGFLGKLLGGLPGPSSAPGIGSSGQLKQQFSLNTSNQGPAIPWRRANVRHTSNELYVDIVESLSVTLAPSGRPLAAFANGSILFTSKISGVPDLSLTLSASGGKLGMEKAIELPVFHPCVRLARWKDHPGELSFVPPDGKFVLAGYEVNLMPTNMDFQSWSNVNLQLPVLIEVAKSLGPAGAEFEVKLILSSTFPGASSLSVPPARPGLGTRGSGRSTPIFAGGNNSGPSLQDLAVTVPVPAGVRNITDLRASRGEAFFNPADNMVEWRISTKEAATAGSATLRCTVVGPLDDIDEDDGANGLSLDAANGEYDENEDTYQTAAAIPTKPTPSIKEQHESRDQRKVQMHATLMPSSASVSFSVKNWLASGIKVDGLVLDTKKSRGLGEGVKPYKGVKYMTVSKKGVETRC